MVVNVFCCVCSLLFIVEVCVVSLSPSSSAQADVCSNVTVTAASTSTRSEKNCVVYVHIFVVRVSVVTAIQQYLEESLATKYYSLHNDDEDDEDDEEDEGDDGYTETKQSHYSTLDTYKY